MAALKSLFNSAVERGVAPVQAKYIADLRRMKEAYTKAGDLDAVILVDREIKAEFAKEEFGKAKLPENDAELKDFLIANVWIVLGEEKAKYSFAADGSIAITASKAKPTFKVTGRRSFIMSWSTAPGDEGITCRVSEDCLAFAELSGGRHVWTREKK